MILELLLLIIIIIRLFVKRFTRLSKNGLRCFSKPEIQFIFRAQHFEAMHALYTKININIANNK